MDNQFNTDLTYIQNSSIKLNENLDTVFKAFRITKNKQNLSYSDEIDVDGMYKLEIKIPKQIRDYYRGIEKLSGIKLTYFRNCCRLYNIAQTAGVHEPTLMISYIISAVECLAKSEGLDYSPFMKKYLDTEYEKSFCDDLYGKIRSGHFHSGEMYFNEYIINLDITLDEDFTKKQNQLLKARRILRLVLINWVKQNILPLGRPKNSSL